MPSEILTLDVRTRVTTSNILSLDVRTILGLAAPLFLDIRTRTFEELVCVLDVRTNILPAAIPDGFVTWQEYIEDLGYSTPQEYYTADGYTNLPLSPQSDWHVYIDGVEDTEVNLNSININVTVDSNPTASFMLPRRFDNPNYKASGLLSTITSKNIITIYFGTRLVFTGKVVGIAGNNGRGSDGVITVKCEGAKNSLLIRSSNFTFIRDEESTAETGRRINSFIKNLSLSSLNSQLHPYDIIDCSVDLNNLLLQSESFNSAQQIYKGTKVDLGYEEIENIRTGYETYTTWETLDDFVPDPEKEYFYVVKTIAGNDYYKYIGKDLDKAKQYVLDEQVTLNNGLSSMTFYTCWNYQVKNKTQIDEDDLDLYESDYIVKEAIAGTDTINIDFGEMDYNYYIVNKKRLGYYYVGASPYQEITCANGKFASSVHYAEASDGLYLIKEPEYDYINYAKRQATAEYLKLDLHHTSATISLSLDGWLYYQVKLTDKINIINTIGTNIFTSSQGFPLTVKTLEFDSQNMKVIITINSDKSTLEGYPQNSNPTVVSSTIGAINGGYYFVPYSLSQVYSMAYVPELYDKLPTQRQKLFDRADLRA